MNKRSSIEKSNTSVKSREYKPDIISRSASANALYERMMKSKEVKHSKKWYDFLKK